MPMTARKKMTCIQKRRGFALVELCITIALLAVASIMIVSFSALYGGHVSKSEKQYLFLDEVNLYRKKLQTWISERDVANAEFTVSPIGISVEEEQSPAVTSEGIFVVFALPEYESPNQQVLKCTMESDLGETQVFLLTLQCGSFAKGGT